MSPLTGVILTSLVVVVAIGVTALVWFWDRSVRKERKAREVLVDVQSRQAEESFRSFVEAQNARIRAEIAMDCSSCHSSSNGSSSTSCDSSASP